MRSSAVRHSRLVETVLGRTPYESQKGTFDSRETPGMLRTIFSIGLFAILGLVALKFLFGILGVAVGLFLWLLVAAIKVGLVLLVVYFIIRIVSPETARKLRERWAGPAA